MKIPSWRWRGVCALAASLALTGATTPADAAEPTRSASVAAFESGLHQAIASDDAEEIPPNPFADDPIATDMPVGPSMTPPNGISAAPPWPCDDCEGGCTTGRCGVGSRLLGRGIGQGYFGDGRLLRRLGGSGGSYARVEYLMWWTDGMDLPALVTTSPAGTLQGDAAELPGATVLFGDESVDDDLRSGGRLEIGYWLDSCHDYGLVGRFFALGEGDVQYDAASDGSRILGRPIVRSELGFIEQASLISFPGLVRGAISIDTSNDVLVSDVFLRRSLLTTRQARLDLIAGYFFSRIDESVEIDSSQLGLSGGGAGTRIDVFDAFRTENEFHGGQFGLMTERECGMWSLRMIGKVALGNMNQRVDIAGSRVTTAGGASASSQGGLLALDSNIGEYETNEFAVVPEFDLTVGYQISRRLEATMSYSFIYWSDVARPGDAIDRTVNLSQVGGAPLTGPRRPVYNHEDSDFWAQGLSFGLKYEY